MTKAPTDAAELALLMAEHGLSAKALATMTKRSKQQINRILADGSVLKPSTADHIALAIDRWLAADHEDDELVAIAAEIAVNKKRQAKQAIADAVPIGDLAEGWSRGYQWLDVDENGIAAELTSPSGLEDSYYFDLDGRFTGSDMEYKELGEHYTLPAFVDRAGWEAMSAADRRPGSKRTKTAKNGATRKTTDQASGQLAGNNVAEPSRRGIMARLSMIRTQHAGPCGRRFFFRANRQKNGRAVSGRPSW